MSVSRFCLSSDFVWVPILSEFETYHILDWKVVMQYVWESIGYVNEVQLMKWGPVSVQLVTGLRPPHFTFLICLEWVAIQKSSERDRHVKRYVSIGSVGLTMPSHLSMVPPSWPAQCNTGEHRIPMDFHGFPQDLEGILPPSRQKNKLFWGLWMPKSLQFSLNTPNGT